VISEDFAFFGFDAKSWDRLVSLFLGEDGDRPRGVLVLVIDANRIPVASFHTARGSIDPATLPSADTLEALCHATNAGACIVMRQRGIADVEAYLAEPLDPDQDFVARVMRFAHVLRELGNGTWASVWPNPLPDVLLSAAPAAKPALDFLLPNGRNVVLGIFEDGELWTGAVLRRSRGSVDLFAGPSAISDWAGPLGGDWRRDHRVLTAAAEREVGPIHAGLFMNRATAQRLIGDRRAGDWAKAYLTRELLVHPLPAFAAAGLGLDVLGGAAQYALQTLDQMEAEELVSIAQGFWQGLTDGKGLEGLLGFSPVQAVSEAVNRALSEPPKEEADPRDDERRDPLS
jgi:hypothetical protein